MLRSAPNVVGIAPHVSGPIVDLRVADNQFVKQGDLLFAIDCRPLRGAAGPRPRRPGAHTERS